VSDDGRPFVGGALAWLAALGALTLGICFGAGVLNRPTPLAPSTAELDRHASTLVLFGNSRFEAAFDPDELGTALGTGCKMYSGGGWHALHYQQLALINARALRSGRDAVAIDVSILSMQQATPTRLGVIRPEAALSVATLPGLPTEARLDVLLGAIDPLYRYRATIQGRLAGPLENAVRRLPLPWGASPAAAPYRLVTDPERNWVMKSIEGDREAFRQESRRRLLETARTLETVPSQRAAIEVGVRRLRTAGVAVALVEVPVSRWLDEKLAGPVVADHRAWLDRLASETGAHVLRSWPAELHDEALFYDDQHYFSLATPAVDRAFAAALRPVLPTPP
jgi:hypothetical protein